MTRTRFVLWTAGALFVALVVLGGGLAAQTPAEKFTRAQLMELNEGDLDGALALYREVAADARAPAPLQAQALFRQGLCLIKRDDHTAARRAFEQVVRNHARTDPAVQAELMLKSLGASQAALTPARDIAQVVQDLLVEGSNYPGKTTPLTRLRFLGEAARDELRRAVGHANREIRVMALNLLAEMGDVQIAGALIDQLGSDDFRRYADRHTKLCEARALATLIQKKPEIQKLVMAAYKHRADGPARANALRVLVEAGLRDRVSDLRAHLESEDPSMRTAAWWAASQGTAGDEPAGSSFLDDLLRVWKKQPAWRPELVRYLVDPGRVLAAGDTVRKPLWHAAVIEAAKSTDAKVCRRVLDLLSYGQRELWLGLRAALLQSPDAGVQRTAADLDLKQRPDLTLEDVKPAHLHDFSEALLAAAARCRSTDPKHADRLLRDYRDGVVPLLSPAAYAEMLDRLVHDKRQRSSLDMGSWDNLDRFTRASLDVFRVDVAGAHGNGDRFNDPTEKYLPVLLEYAGPAGPEAVRMMAVQSLGNIMARTWNRLSVEDRNRIKAFFLRAMAELQSDTLSAAFKEPFERSVYDLLRAIMRKQPRIVTVEELLAHADFGRWNQLPALRNIFERTSNQDLEKAILSGALEAREITKPHIELLKRTNLPANQRDAILRNAWPRATTEARGTIIQVLEPTPENLAFLDRITTPDLDHSLSVEVTDRLLGWNSREAVPALIRLLDSDDTNAKIKACRALGSLADPRAVPALIQLLTFQNAEVRAAAEKALTAIRNLKKKQDEWKSWWEQQQEGKKRNESKEKQAGR